MNACKLIPVSWRQIHICAGQPTIAKHEQPITAKHELSIHILDSEGLSFTNVNASLAFVHLDAVDVTPCKLSDSCRTTSANLSAPAKQAAASGTAFCVCLTYSVRHGSGHVYIPL